MLSRGTVQFSFMLWIAVDHEHNEDDPDVTKTGNGERGAGNGERKSGNELSAETSTKIQNGGPKNEREKEEDKERNSCLA